MRWFRYHSRYQSRLHGIAWLNECQRFFSLVQDMSMKQIDQETSYIPELNFSKGFLSQSEGLVGMGAVLMALSLSRSKLKLSAILRKLTASMPFGCLMIGMMGGSQWRRSAQLIGLNHACCFTSAAPARHPNRLCSSLCSSFLTRLRQELDTEVLWFGGGQAGNSTSSFRILENVSLRLVPLNGVVPYWIWWKQAEFQMGEEALTVSNVLK